MNALQEGASARQPLVEVRGLRIHFPIRGGFFGRQVGAVKAVDGVSFRIARGQVVPWQRAYVVNGAQSW